MSWAEWNTLAAEYAADDRHERDTWAEPGPDRPGADPDGPDDQTTPGRSAWAPRPCPECATGKHANCHGDAWDHDRDRPAMCPCWREGHQP